MLRDPADIAADAEELAALSQCHRAHAGPILIKPRHDDTVPPCDAATLFIRRSSRLTPRERTLVDALLVGQTNKETATLLGLSQYSVKVFNSRLFAKFGAKDRFQLQTMFRDPRVMVTFEMLCATLQLIELTGEQKLKAAEIMFGGKTVSTAAKPVLTLAKAMGVHAFEPWIGDCVTIAAIPINSWPTA